MNEITIDLSAINPVDLLGVANKHLNKIVSYFPKLKIIARGNKIKAYGNPELLSDFEHKIYTLIKIFNKYNKLDATLIENLFEASETSAVFLEEKHEHNRVLVHGVGGRIIKARTENQQKMVDAIQKNDMLFSIGPAGTGKTYTAVALAVKSLKERQVKKIILTRPAVESGENLGFLPGDLKEKLDPYMQPLYDSLRDMIPSERLNDYLEKGTIQIAPLAFMRGRTLDDAFVILDEAQNTNQRQMKMFLTRMGKNAKFIITGDPEQIDLPKHQVSGLKHAMDLLNTVTEISIVMLTKSDVIRHRLVKKIIDAYQNKEQHS